MRFSRQTLFETVDALDLREHAQIDEFIYRFGIEQSLDGMMGGVRPKLMAIKRFLIDNPEAVGPAGSALAYEVVEYVLKTRLAPYSRYDTELRDPDEVVPELKHCLELDGFHIVGDTLQADVPEELDLPEIHSRLEVLLDQHGLTVPKGHLDQARASYARGEWAAANGQLRTFVEALFIGMAEAKGGTGLTSGHQAMGYLAKLPNPIVSEGLNEWDSKDNGKGFLPGFWKRLHPQGSHPGLSDESDSSLRLRLALLVCGHYLELFHSRSCAVQTSEHLRG